MTGSTTSTNEPEPQQGDTWRLAKVVKVREFVSRSGKEMVEWAGPWEQDRCKHGRFYSFRWSFNLPKGQEPTREDFESSEPDIRGNRCKECKKEDEADDDLL